MTRLLYGRPLAETVNAETRTRAGRLSERHGRAPALSVVMTGADPSAATYLGSLESAGKRLGVGVQRAVVARGADEAAYAAVLRGLAKDEAISGILLLTPLAPGVELTSVAAHLPPAKDVEGMHPLSAGLLAAGRPRFVPTTADAVIALLRHYEITLRGSRVTVVGRSLVFGRPLAALMLMEHATVTIAHSQTPDLPSQTRSADIVCIGIGQAGALTGEMIREGAVVIDAGINVRPEGIVGDVDATSVAAVASAYSPVPGGLGAVTTALLMRNVVSAAEG